MLRDFFGQIIRRNIFGGRISRKQIKREVISENRRKGSAAEENAKFNAMLQGIEYERTGRGHDFKAYKTNIITGKKTFLGYREIKSSLTAPLSELQKKTQKKMKGKYKIIRQNPEFF